MTANVIRNVATLCCQHATSIKWWSALEHPLFKELRYKVITLSRSSLKIHTILTFLFLVKALRGHRIADFCKYLKKYKLSAVSEYYNQHRWQWQWHVAIMATKSKCKTSVMPPSWILLKVELLQMEDFQYGGFNLELRPWPLISQS